MRSKVCPPSVISMTRGCEGFCLVVCSPARIHRNRCIESVTAAALTIPEDAVTPSENVAGCLISWACFKEQEGFFLSCFHMPVHCSFSTPHSHTACPFHPGWPKQDRGPGGRLEARYFSLRSWCVTDVPQAAQKPPEHPHIRRRSLYGPSSSRRFLLPFSGVSVLCFAASTDDVANPFLIFSCCARPGLAGDLLFFLNYQLHAMYRY